MKEQTLKPASSIALSIALTGADSFTGLSIAQTLAAGGWPVHGLFGTQRSANTGLRGLRTDKLAEVATLHEAVLAEDGEMERWIRAHRPEIWIHHHHFMENYRSPKYDIARARAVTITPLHGIVSALATSGCKGVIYTGSFFEPSEGNRDPKEPVTPYGSSKAEVWQTLKKECETAKLPLSKIVIPNPVGPYENEDRLIPVLLKHTRTSQPPQPFVLQNPGSRSDYIPAQSLATVYAKACERLTQGDAGVFRPSGRLATLREWVEEVCEELIRKRLRLAPPRLEEPNSRPASTSHTNPESERLQVDWDEFWDSYAESVPT